MGKSKVYFTSKISPESVVNIYEKLGIELKGKVAVKLHSGEHGNKNYLRPEFVKTIVERVNGTVVECNTAYPGERNTTEKHKKLMEENNLENKNIYVFVTSGGTGSEGSFKDLKDTYKNLNFISSKRFIGKESNEEYTNWIK